MSGRLASPHLHAASVSALLAHDPEGRTKSQIAADAGFTPANVREFETSVRTGARAATRRRLAGALRVPPGAITCWCDRPDGICRSIKEETNR